MSALGPAFATQYIERFGFPENSLPRNLTLALGTAQVSPLEMASAYSVFANGGYRVDSYYLDRIRGPDGKIVFESQPRFVCRGCLEPTAAAATASVAGPIDTMQANSTPADAAMQSVTNDERSWGGQKYLQEKMLAPASISPQNDYLMADMMGDVVKRGT